MKIYGLIYFRSGVQLGVLSSFGFKPWAVLVSNRWQFGGQTVGNFGWRKMWFYPYVYGLGRTTVDGLTPKPLTV